MWNKIDPLIQPITRKVEKSNPRMDIRRDESESYGGRKRGSGEEESFSIPWEDSTVVSVVGLRNFLQSLIGGQQPSAEGAEENTEEESLPPPEPTPLPVQAPVNPYMSRAASAYQTTGKIVHDRNIEIATPSPPPTGNAVSLGSDFGETEIEDIRGYIDALSDLEAKGVTDITLLRTLTFLESVKQGIEDARFRV